MKLTEIECDFLLDYENNSPIEQLENQNINVNDYILLSLMLKRNNRNEYLEDLLLLLNDIETSLINKDMMQLSWEVDAEYFKFEIEYACTNEGDYAGGDPTLQVDAEYRLLNWDLKGIEKLPLSAQKYMNIRIDELINENPA